MVQIFDLPQTAGGQLGQAIGQGLQSGLGQVFQQQYQKGLVNESFKPLEGLTPAQYQNMSLPQLLSTVAKPFLSIGQPGEIALSRILPSIIQNFQGKMVPNPNELTGAGGGVFGNAGQPGGQLQNQQPRQLAQNIGQTQNQPGVGVGTPSEKPSREITNFLGQYLPQDISGLINPQQRADVLDRVRKQGGDVDFARQQIDDYNTGKIAFTDLQNANVEKQAAQFQRQLALENQLRKFIDEQLPKDTPESDKRIYYNMIKKRVGEHEDLSSAYQAVSKDIENFKTKRDAFINNIPSADINPFGPSAATEKILRSSGQKLLDIDPLAYNVIEDAFTQKGHSLVVPQHIFRPLSQALDKSFDSAKDFNASVFPWYTPSEKQMLDNLANVAQEQQKESESIADRIAKNFDENTSLVNIYTKLKARAWFPEQIFSTFQRIKEKLEEKGRALSSQQEKELSQLAQPPQIPPRYLFNK